MNYELRIVHCWLLPVAAICLHFPGKWLIGKFRIFQKLPETLNLLIDQPSILDGLIQRRIMHTAVHHLLVGGNKCPVHGWLHFHRPVCLHVIIIYKFFFGVSSKNEVVYFDQSLVHQTQHHSISKITAIFLNQITGQRGPAITDPR